MLPRLSYERHPVILNGTGVLDFDVSPVPFDADFTVEYNFEYDPDDPVKYDFALYGFGLHEII